MIDFEYFKRAMDAISERCARPLGSRQLTMYYRFLSPRLTTEEFAEAARTVWSSAEFFPPPIAFLGSRAGKEWDRVERLITDYTPPNVRDGWVADWAALSEETKLAVSRLGGPLAFKDSVYNRSPAKAYEVFTRTFTEALKDSAPDLVEGGGAMQLTDGGTT